MTFNKQSQEQYWSGYRAMKRAFERTGNLQGAYSEIDQSNASNTYAKGARRAMIYLRDKQSR